MSRPEHIAPADIFYNDVEAKKYAANSRMIQIQSQMSQRAIELLQMPPKQTFHILDIGCGSGLSGEVLTEMGHTWVGIDISQAMLGVAVEREVEGDLVYQDMGHGLPFRAGTFDGCISISAVQWLCNADHKKHIPQKRMKRFFQTLYNCLARGARAVLQLYPETPQQMSLITKAAMSAGFSGGIVVDYPNSTKAKKIFLCLAAGSRDGTIYRPPEGLESEDMDVEGGNNNNSSSSSSKKQVLFQARERTRKHRRRRKGEKRAPIKSKSWIADKKERMRAQGRKVARDSKYSGRRRKPKF